MKRTSMVITVILLMVVCHDLPPNPNFSRQPPPIPIASIIFFLPSYPPTLLPSFMGEWELSSPQNGLSGIYEPPCCSGSGYDPPGTILSEVPLTRPSGGQSVIDTTFGTTITALPADARNTYSQLQVWSHDNRYMITVSPGEGYYHVRDAATYAVLWTVDRSMPRWIPGTHRVVTVDNQPGRIFVYDVDTGTETLWMNLSPFQFISSQRAFEEPSRGGEWMSLYVTDDGSGYERLVTVNLKEKRLGMNRRLQDMCAPDPEWGLLEPDWIGVSPNGNYAVVQWVKAEESQCGGMELFDIETGDFVRRMYTHHSHSDLGLDENGKEVIVTFELFHPDNNNVPAVALYPLDGSGVQYLRMVPWFRADHVSCQGPGGLCLITAGNDSGDPLLKGELYVLYFDGSLRRIVHHRSDSCDYWNQPKATLSLDGSRVAFSSDWRGSCSGGGGFVMENLSLVTPGSGSPRISLDRGRLNFGVSGSAVTGGQEFRISNGGTGTLAWGLSAGDSRVSFSPSSGSGSGAVTVSVDASGLGTGSYTYALQVSAAGASNSPQTVTVALTVMTAGFDQPPFGVFEAPVNGATVRSSVPVTGWVLDDIGVDRVEIHRNAVSGEAGGWVYIGNALLVEGVRTDIEDQYSQYPFHFKGGWGYMMLTNFLPNSGNGSFTIHAVAVDNGGNRATLGSRSITVDNAGAEEPFGAIDFPAPGEVVSGTAYVNIGWVLTPPPGKVPEDGSTIRVYIDDVPVGQPEYNQYRSDVAGLFPGYANSGGSMGTFTLDTTQYEDGRHTIAWLATDDRGNSGGIGSRYFYIYNNTGQ